MYTGNDRTAPLSARQPVYADIGAPKAAAAQYNAKPAVYRAEARTPVPALTATMPALAAAAKSAAAAQEKAAPKQDRNVLQKIGDAFADAFKAVKNWISGAITWVHDKIMGKGRPLTPEEIAEMRKIFGDSVDYSKVRIVTGDNMGLWGKILTSGGAAVTWGKTIYFPNSGGKSQYSFDTKAYWLAHEMTHEYQYQKYGWGYAASSVWGQLRHGDSFYEYQLEAGKGFRDYNVEQQADLVAHYYQILNGTRSATAEETAIYAEIMAGQGLF